MLSEASKDFPTVAAHLVGFCPVVLEYQFQVCGDHESNSKSCKPEPDELKREKQEMRPSYRNKGMIPRFIRPPSRRSFSL